MARPIDANELYRIEKLLDTDIVRQDKVALNLLEQVLYDIQHVPTLTPPNETPPCYQPDGDGCAYQCYDGDDEPIDKCKECPLCYSDKQRHRTTPNEPLTLDELRQMDGEPVWVEFQDGSGGLWGIVHITIFAQIVFANGLHCTIGERYYGKSYKAYRRPPEGEEDT